MGKLTKRVEEWVREPFFDLQKEIVEAFGENHRAMAAMVAARGSKLVSWAVARKLTHLLQSERRKAKISASSADVTIDELNLPFAAKRALSDLGCEVVSDVASVKPSQILALSGVGEGTVNKIRLAISIYGYQLASDF